MALQMCLSNETSDKEEASSFGPLIGLVILQAIKRDPTKTRIRRVLRDFTRLQPHLYSTHYFNLSVIVHLDNWLYFVCMCD